MRLIPFGCLCCSAPAADFPQTVQFQGRWELEGDRRRATWCGSSLHFRTASQSICVEFGELTTPRDAQGQANVLCSFGPSSAARTERVEGPHTLFFEPDSTPAGAGADALRDVTIMLCDWGAALHITNIYTTDGLPILAPAADLPVRPLLFIGASLVSGFSPLFREDLPPQGTHEAFASVVVRELRARGLADVRLEMVAYPGVRLMTKADKTGMEDAFWDGRDGLGAWDTRSRDPPDDIFICIGTNDQGWGEDKDKFLTHYKAFLVRLRDSYQGSCKRIYVISPFGVFRATRRAIYEPEVQHMVEALAESWASSEPDGIKLYHISTDGWIDKSLTFDGLHPTAKGHEEIGAKLVQFMESRGLV